MNVHVSGYVTVHTVHSMVIVFLWPPSLVVKHQISVGRMTLSSCILHTINSMGWAYSAFG